MKLPKAQAKRRRLPQFDQSPLLVQIFSSRCSGNNVTLQLVKTEEAPELNGEQRKYKATHEPVALRSPYATESAPPPDPNEPLCFVFSGDCLYDPNHHNCRNKQIANDAARCDQVLETAVDLVYSLETNVFDLLPFSD